MSYTGSIADFLADVKGKLFLPIQQVTFTDQQILDIAYEEMMSSVYPKIMGCREGYFSAFVDVAISSTRRYRIPKRAIGGKIYDIQITDGGAVFSLNQVHRFDIQRREGFYLDNSDIVLTSQTRQQGTMRIVYPVRPYPFTASPATTTVASVGSGTCTASIAPGVSTADIQQPNSPFSIIAPDCAVSGTSLTFNSDLNVAAGDLISKDGTTPMVPLPIEAQDLLALRTAHRILGYLGQAARQGALAEKIKDSEAYVLNLMSPRVDGEEKVINEKELLGIQRNW